MNGICFPSSPLVWLVASTSISYMAKPARCKYLTPSKHIKLWKQLSLWHKVSLGCMFLHMTYVAALLNFVVKCFHHWGLSSLTGILWKKVFTKYWFYRKGFRSSRGGCRLMNFKQTPSSCVDRMHSLKGRYLTPGFSIFPFSEICFGNIVVSLGPLLAACNEYFWRSWLLQVPSFWWCI